ncbi:MAG: sulfatase-like hydrolase/transferase [Candidatus Cyclobacteriaceae bacterium M3_2C_046]
MKYFILLFAVVCTGMACFSCKSPQPEPPPNIILIMADDLGYGGIGCFGNQQVQTPHLDKLAVEGIKFTDFHANGPVCTPTRAALITGRYQQRAGLEGVIYVRGDTRETGLDTTHLSIAEVMKKHGYTTGMMGKWHLGYDQEYNPVYHGFDQFYGYRSGNVDYHSHYDNAGIYDWFHQTDTLVEQGYVTDLITQHSVDFINQNREQPFFLLVNHEAPHVPFQGRNDPAYRFPDQEFSYHGPVEDQHRAYKEMIEVMDEGIGEIVQAVKQNGLAERTLVIFLSDNGGLNGYGDNGPLNGAKGNLYEGGHRVPAIAWWPDKIQPGVSDQLLMSFDLFPTVLSVCAIDPAQYELDGVDFSSVLFDQADLPERDLFWRYRDQKAVRSDSIKLLITKQDTLLFNLYRDLAEQNSIKNKSVKDRMLQKLEQWENEMAQYRKKTS